MLKEIAKDIYLNEIDLPKSPLKYLNSYIIRTPDRSLVIDTGFNRPECEEKFFAGLRELDIDLEKTDVLITHLHSDHCGLMAPLAEKGARILIGEREGNDIMSFENDAYWEKFRNHVHMYGADEEGLELAEHPGYRFRPQPIKNFTPLNAGEVLGYAGYELEVLSVPGHTKGHIALYEKEHGFLFSGDLVLDKITPTITFWGFEQDILQVYMDTIRRVEKLKINKVLTGHRALLSDFGKRADELIKHHERRLDEIVGILSDGEKTVCRVAALMSWDITAKNWDDFPRSQKWFALGEAMSHLEHLYCTGRAKREERDGVLYYSK